LPLDLDPIRTRFPNRRIHWHSSISSTMHEAVRLANSGAPTGTVVGADEQTAGHGRYNRTWHSERDSGLYQSLILRLPIEPAALPVVTLALGLATAAAIEQTTAVDCDLRWPNDVLIADRKVAGILVQLHDHAVVAGIGINVIQSAFPDDVAAIATSLRLATKRTQSREALLIALLDEIDTHCDILIQDGPAAILNMFEQASTYVAGRRVIIDDHLTGTTAGLTPTGFLRLQLDNGTEQLILAGGVRPLATRHSPLAT
jgi:BirA family biotin operon repressor/biotin-[acetyl-CoA-carboxylase] ligase